MNVTNVSVKIHDTYLMDYIKSKHKGVRYECDQCEYKATFKGNPSKHKK